MHEVDIGQSQVRTLGGLLQPAEPGAGRQADTGAFGADLFGDRLGDLNGEAGAVLDAAA
jgi:hypothetical protein